MCIEPENEIAVKSNDLPAMLEAYRRRERALPTYEELQRVAGEVDSLRSKAFAFDEWIEKTNWVQEQISTFSPQALGKHLADVMRDAIESLRKQLEEVTSSRDAFKSLYDKTLDDIGAALVSRDADIERAIRIAVKQTLATHCGDDFSEGYGGVEMEILDILAQVKEQGK